MRSRRRPLVVVSAAVLGLLTARVVAGDLAALHRRAEALGPARTVVVVTSDLGFGAVLQAADLDVRRVHEPPPGAVPRLPLAVGKHLAVPVLAGSALTGRHLRERDERVPAGMRAVRVRVEPAWEVAGGTVVDLLAPNDGPGVGGELAAVVAQGAVVLSESSGRPGEDSARPGENTGAVTVLVSLETARRVAAAAAAGPLTLALAPPEDACCKKSPSASSRG